MAGAGTSRTASAPGVTSAGGYPVAVKQLYRRDMGAAALESYAYRLQRQRVERAGGGGRQREETCTVIARLDGV